VIAIVAGLVALIPFSMALIWIRRRPVTTVEIKLPAD